jgi:hypothetical protein
MYASLLISGQIPYLDYNLEYPQLFFFPVILASIPTLIINDSWIYFFSHMTLMSVTDAATLVCVYILAHQVLDSKKAFLCGLLYATAIPASFFIPITYDIVPTFILMLSLVLYTNGKQISGYLSATIGALTKWFPVFVLPCFVLHEIKTGHHPRAIGKSIAASILLFAAFTVPFIILNREGFLYTYFVHFNRLVETHSLIYYGDIFTRFFWDIQPFSTYSLALLLILECSVLYWYFRYARTDYLTLCYTVFLCVFLFILVNKAFSACFIIWITPFLAIFLVQTYKEIILFYLIEIIIYCETPLLYDIVYRPYRFYELFENSLPSVSFVFYTIKFCIYFIVLWVILQKIRAHQNAMTC